MTWKNLVIGILLSIFLVPGIVSAQEGTATSPARQNLQQSIPDRSMSDEVMEKRQEFRDRLQTIKDEKKREVVQRIDAKITAVSKNVTDRFSGIIDTLQSILNRFVGRAQDATLEGKDTESLNLAIQDAQEAIDNASNMVATQSAKSYVIEIGTDSTLRNDVGSIVSEFRQDLRLLYNAVISAKQAVQNVVREYNILGSEGGVMEEQNTATESSQ